MQEVLEFVLKNITTAPDDVKIDVENQEDGTTNYIVTVNPADVGRIIGKEGKVIKAIRTIMRVIAIQRGVHVRISVVSENGPQGSTMTDMSTQTDETVMSSETTEAPVEPIAEVAPEATVETPDNDTFTVEV